MSERPVNVGIVGLGYWGPNLLRIFRSLESCRATAIADTNPARLIEPARVYPDLRTFPSAEALIQDDEIDAVVLALPARLLPPLAMMALERGKHVIVEKPMADSLERGREMLRAAAASDRVSIVDLTFVYSPPVRYLRELVREGTLGEPHYYQSTRINLGRFQPDVDVVWDLVVHDVAILAFVLGRDPDTVMATGRGRTGASIDTAHVTLSYGDGFQAFIHVSWMAPTKVRTALFAGERGMAVYNDVNADEKIRLYQVQEAFDPGQEDSIVPTFRLGDLTVPRLPSEEPLRAMASAFAAAVHGGPTPPTDWTFGTRVLAVLDAARRSLASGEAARLDDPVAAR
ncbi:MAG: Gfo/Idh/MocA family oxidoreductase [Actinobacteria bacterium]|nr:Gfo/Idh/MocA family oxidoreductase [Actinomycetota bacterium]